MGNTEDLGQGNFTWRIRVCSTFHISICINMLPWKLFKSSGIKSNAKKFKFNRKFILWLTWIIVVTTVTITQFFIAFYKKLFFFLDIYAQDSFVLSVGYSKELCLSFSGTIMEQWKETRRQIASLEVVHAKGENR